MGILVLKWEDGSGLLQQKICKYNGGKSTREWFIIVARFVYYKCFWSCFFLTQPGGSDKKWCPFKNSFIENLRIKILFSFPDNSGTHTK